MKTSGDDPHERQDCCRKEMEPGVNSRRGAEMLKEQREGTLATRRAQCSLQRGNTVRLIKEAKTQKDEKPRLAPGGGGEGMGDTENSCILGAPSEIFRDL